MAVNLINGNDTTITKTNDDIQVEFSQSRSQQISNIEKNIDDLSETINEMKETEVYSTDEQRIGAWIDGKPIYRKVIVISNFAVADNTEYRHGISNIETIVSCQGTFNYGDNQFYNYPLVAHSGKILGVLVTPTKIIWVGDDNWGGSTTRTHTFIIEYTKTS